MPNFNRISSSDLSDYILFKLKDVSHLKLQKLMYYIESWHLAVFTESIIDEDFEAWLHGPVIRGVYARFVGNGHSMYDHLSFKNEKIEGIAKAVETQLHQDQIELIADVLSEYGNKSDYHLECLTHSEAPWIEARKGVEPGEASRNKLSKETMKSFYAQLLGS